MSQGIIIQLKDWHGITASWNFLLFFLVGFFHGRRSFLSSSSLAFFKFSQVEQSSITVGVGWKTNLVWFLRTASTVLGCRLISASWAAGAGFHLFSISILGRLRFCSTSGLLATRLCEKFVGYQRFWLNEFFIADRNLIRRHLIEIFSIEAATVLG